MPYNRTIPKSGYRFSDKIKRKRQSTTAEHHRVTPEPAVGPVFGSIMLGARGPD
jgi:DNA-binding winged helix-turn-helix (wHTH) protein